MLYIYIRQCIHVYVTILYIQKSMHVYIYIYIYTRSFSTHINAYMFEIMIMLPLKYIHHIYICLWFIFSLSYCFILMSYITIMLSNLSLRKCPPHSKFLGSPQSSHSVSWNCRSTQYFDNFKNTWSNQGWEFLSWGIIVHLLNEISFRNAYFIRKLRWNFKVLDYSNHS